MKYLKLFENYSDDKSKLTDYEFYEICEDNLIDLIDNNYEIDTVCYPEDEYYNFDVEITHADNDVFSASDIFDDIHKLIDYMENKYPNFKFNYDILSYELGDRIEITDISLIKPDHTISHIILRFIDTI